VIRQSIKTKKWFLTMLGKVSSCLTYVSEGRVEGSSVNLTRNNGTYKEKNYWLSLQESRGTECGTRPPQSPARPDNRYSLRWERRRGMWHRL